MTALRAVGLHAGWDASNTIAGLDVTVGPGDRIAVLGGNGSGKSTLLAVLAGLLRPRQGQVWLGEQRVDGLAAHRVARLGLRLLPQTRRVFPAMTVAENLAVAERGVPRHQVAAVRATQARWLARLPQLAASADQPAANLSGGQQQLLALVRILSCAPRVLLLDEPFAGLSTAIAADITKAIGQLADTGTAVVLVEQNEQLAAENADRVLRLRAGALQEGRPWTTTSSSSVADQPGSRPPAPESASRPSP
jgi:branched-chain amino acid transport system ATP-binding protein